MTVYWIIVSAVILTQSALLIVMLLQGKTLPLPTLGRRIDTPASRPEGMLSFYFSLGLWLIFFVIADIIVFWPSLLVSD